MLLLCARLSSVSLRLCWGHDLSYFCLLWEIFQVLSTKFSFPVPLAVFAPFEQATYFKSEDGERGVRKRKNIRQHNYSPKSGHTVCFPGFLAPFLRRREAQMRLRLCFLGDMQYSWRGLPVSALVSDYLFSKQQPEPSFKASIGPSLCLPPRLFQVLQRFLTSFRVKCALHPTVLSALSAQTRSLPRPAKFPVPPP